MNAAFMIINSQEQVANAKCLRALELLSLTARVTAHTAIMLNAFPTISTNRLVKPAGCT